MEEYEILRDLINFNTAFDVQNKSIMEYLDDFFRELGFLNHYVIDEDTQKLALICSIGENPELGFVCHTDTSPMGREWDYDAMDLTIDGDKLIGLGVCDDKGGMAAALYAVKRIDWKKAGKGLKLYFTFDEENNFNGIKCINEAEKNFPQNIIVPSPTNLHPVIVTKGMLKFNVLIMGKEAHSSNPNNGVNAIETGVAFLSELYQFNAKLKEDKSKAFEVPYTSFNLGKIQGGTSMNRVPGECSLFFEYRTSKVAHHKMIIDKVKALCEKYQAYMTIIDEVPLMNTFAETFVVKLEEITGKLRGSVAVTSDGNYIRNRNVILLGPGPITGNEKNEYISKFSFDTLVDIYEKIIREYCEVSGGVKATPTTSEAPAEPVKENVEETPSEEAPAKKAKK